MRGDLEWDYMMLGDSLITDYAAGRDTVTVDSGYTLYSKYYSNLGNAVSLTPALVSDSSVVVFWEIELANRDDGALVTTDFCRQYYLDWPSVNTTADSLTSTTAQVYLVPLVNAFVWRVKACLGVSINDPVQVGAKLTQWGGQ
ncbi:hypothetical protein KAH55_13260 [bacterium]|nr:hypothetical protein [bacterium]